MKFLTINEVSEYLNIGIKTLYAKTNFIPHYKVGRLLRFKKEDIDQWMESNRTEANNYSPRRQRARRSSPLAENRDVHAIVRKAIDETKGIEYTPHYGKSDRIKSLGKEE